MTGFNKYMWLPQVAFTLLLLSTTAFISCGGGDDPTGEINIPLEVSLHNPEVVATSTTQFIEIKASGSWEISFEYVGDDHDWCTAVPAQGVGSTKHAYIKYSKNNSEEQRQVTVIVNSGAETFSTIMTQLGDDTGGDSGNPPDPDPDPDPTPTPTPGSKWLELPSMNPTANELFVTHTTTLNSKSVRSYSMLFDKTQGIAYWVAYPHYQGFIGSSGRTDAWAYDPKIPSSSQMSSTISGYDRGHQIPSGDRTADKKTNSQTFYYSNMTPQLSRLNQDMWAKLEEQVRGYLSSCDTLYVVTGAILKTVGKNETVKYVNDKSGHKIAVPNYYYKVLLRRKANNYDAIGFWFEHRSYGNSNAGVNQAKTVRAIEQLTGYNFFASLPQDVQDRVETEFKPSSWGLK